MSRLNIANGRIEMVHGSGGRAMAELIDQLFAQAFDNEWLAQSNDQAQFELPSGRVVMATDSHVVSPLFFPGGDFDTCVDRTCCIGFLTFLRLGLFVFCDLFGLFLGGRSGVFFLLLFGGGSHRE